MTVIKFPDERNRVLAAMILRVKCGTVELGERWEWLKVNDEMLAVLDGERVSIQYEIMSEEELAVARAEQERLNDDSDRTLIETVTNTFGYRRGSTCPHWRRGGW